MCQSKNSEHSEFLSEIYMNFKIVELCLDFKSFLNLAFRLLCRKCMYSCRHF